MNRGGQALMNSTYEARIFKLKTNAELQRIMGAYSSHLSGGCFDKIIEMFSCEHEDVRAEMLWGIYDGYEGICRLYNGLYRHEMTSDGKELRAGVLAVHSMNTPVIAIADNCLTARGLWTSPGLMTVSKSDTQKSLQSYWTWQKYGCDFIYENETWKIWHLHVFELFTARYEKSWADGSVIYPLTEAAERFAPDRPPSGAEPWPPLPYEDFNDATPY